MPQLKTLQPDNIIFRKYFVKTQEASRVDKNYTGDRNDKVQN